MFHCEELCGICEEHTEMEEVVCETVWGIVSVNLEEFFVGLCEKLVTYEKNCVRNCEGLCGEMCEREL